MPVKWNRAILKLSFLKGNFGIAFSHQLWSACTDGRFSALLFSVIRAEQHTTLEICCMQNWCLPTPQHLRGAAESVNETTDRVSKRLESYVGLAASLGMERETRQGTVKTDAKHGVLQPCICQGRVQIFLMCGEKNRGKHVQPFCIEGIILLMNKTGKSKANLRNTQNKSSTQDKALNQCVVISGKGICWPSKLWTQYALCVFPNARE